MRRSDRQQSETSAIAPARAIGISGPMGLLSLAIVIISILSMGSITRGWAEPLIETQVMDAQIARGVASPDGLTGDRTPDRVGSPTKARIRALIPDAERHCLGVADQPENPAQIELNMTLRQVQRSEIGAWLASLAAARNVTICLDRATELEAHYRSHLKLLGLSSRLDSAGRVVFLAHELAHIPQHPQFSNNRRFAPVDMVLLQRVREAAAEAIATRVLWQLRERGIDAPWRSKLKTAYRDIALSFEAAMAEGKGPAQELRATRSAFHRWFDAGWRLDTYDGLMFDTLARIATDRVGLIPASRKLSDSYLLGVATYNGQSFLVDGDGRLLIERFRYEDLSVDSRARLNAILETAEARNHEPFSTISSTPLSAVIPRPDMTEGY